MFNSYKKNIKRKIDSYCKTNYQMIDKGKMKIGNGLFNHRCHLNAVQMVKTNQATDVYLVVALNDKEFPFVHFINTDNEGHFIDNTLGWKFELYDYYIIKKIQPEEYKCIESILMETKRALINMYSYNFINKLINLDYDDVI